MSCELSTQGKNCIFSEKESYLASDTNSLTLQDRNKREEMEYINIFFFLETKILSHIRVDLSWYY